MKFSVIVEGRFFKDYTLDPNGSRYPWTPRIEFANGWDTIELAQQQADHFRNRGLSAKAIDKWPVTLPITLGGTPCDSATAVVWDSAQDTLSNPDTQAYQGTDGSYWSITRFGTPTLLGPYNSLLDAYSVALKLAESRVWRRPHIQEKKS